MASELVQINLRLEPAEVEAIDKARPATVARSWWIRGAIRQRLERADAPTDDGVPSEA